MTVMLKATGETAEYSDEYAVRLIEQGVALPVQEEKKPEKEAPKEAGKKKG